MKFTVNGGGLLEALTLASSVVDARSPRHELAHVAVDALGGALDVCATNLEVSLRVRVRAEVQTPGTALLPAARLLSIGRELEADAVAVGVAARVARVSAGGASWSLPTLDASVFPKIPTFEADQAGALCIERARLGAMIARTAFAAPSSSESRPVLKGLLLEVRPDGLRLVASDGSRLALAERREPVDHPAARGVIPVDAAHVLTRMGAPEERLAIRMGRGQLVAQSARVVLCAQLLAGEFPIYANAIPKESVTGLVRLRTAGLVRLLRQARLVLGKGQRGLELAFMPGKLALSLSTAHGTFAAELPVAYEGAPARAAFDPELLLGWVDGVDGETFDFTLSREEGPALLRDGEDLFVCMNWLPPKGASRG